LYRLQQEGLVCSRCGPRIKIKPNTHSIVCGCGNFIKVR
jgi:DNA-directed RNA polymerase subunit RPC12/RpoP